MLKRIDKKEEEQLKKNYNHCKDKQNIMKITGTSFYGKFGNISGKKRFSTEQTTNGKTFLSKIL